MKPKLERLDDGVYYLESIDEKYRRKYQRKTKKAYEVVYNKTAENRMNLVKNQLKF